MMLDHHEHPAEGSPFSEGRQAQQRRAGRWLEPVAGLLVVLLAGAWLVGLFDRVIMPLVVLGGVEVAVPDLHRMLREDADSLCAALGLELVPGRIRIDDRLPVGSILDQFPVAGTSVKPGRRVEVVVSDLTRQVLCSDMMGRSPREASILADSLGLVIADERIRYQHSSLHPEGVVMAQHPEPGAAMMPGDEVLLTVSLGALPTEIVAPDLLGRKLDGVGVVLAKQSLRLGDVVRYPDRAVESGTIISQFPTAGTPMKQGDKVSVHVAVEPRSSPEKGAPPDSSADSARRGR